MVGEAQWGFLTNHALVLVYVIQHRGSTVRDIAAAIGITERAALAILHSLQDEAIIERHRSGRRNTYAVNFDTIATYRRPTVSGETVPDDFMVAVAQTLSDISAGQAGPPPPEPREEARPRATPMFTNHALVLLQVTRNPTATVREMASSLHLTERAIHAILAALESDRIITRSRDGRRNVYEVDLDAVSHFPRWSPGPWRFPPQLVDMTLRSLRQMVAGGNRRAVANG